MRAVIRFAHLSDWHATTLVGAGRAAFRGKRLSGYASWAWSRRHHHDPAILEAALRDVRAQAVDRVLVTGDLTHISLPAEFDVARGQLERLGTPEQVFLIPGNHDCYVPVAPEQGWDRWAGYLRGLEPRALEGALASATASGTGRASGRAVGAATASEQVAALHSALTAPPGVGRAPRHEDYPTLRLHGRAALIGLCSSIPTPIFRAGGLLGPVQLARLRSLLVGLGARGFFRILMIHHPVHPHGEPARRALWDGQALRDLLAEVGAELVLHGHKHRRRVHLLDGPGRAIPAIGVPSSSEVGSRPDRPAQYHVFTVREADDADGFALEAQVRGYDAAAGGFLALPDRLL
ncbi:MAG: metallophosphoesterase [Deltaproteobacteria bacterium]|nr:metallophosphoesterase [Deltaproteobacteria bacterium]